VTLLLDKGASVSAKDGADKTPLALALENRNEEGAALLRQRGATE
jgi:ankyrin repeat protein